MFAEKGRRILQIAVRPRRLVDAPQRPPDQRHIPAIGGGGGGNTVQPGYVGGEATYRDPVLEPPKQLDQALPHRRLRPDVPGTVALVLSQTIASAPSSPNRISAASSVGSPVTGDRIKLPVTGMEHGTQRRAQDQSARLRHRVSHPHQFDIEWTGGEAAGKRHLDDLHPPRQVLLDQLGPQHRSGERRSINRAAKLGPEMGTAPR